MTTKTTTSFLRHLRKRHKRKLLFTKSKQVTMNNFDIAGILTTCFDDSLVLATCKTINLSVHLFTYIYLSIFLQSSICIIGAVPPLLCPQRVNPRVPDNPFLSISIYLSINLSTYIYIVGVELPLLCPPGVHLPVPGQSHP